MKQTQKLHNSAWIAHDCTTSDAILRTLSTSLEDCIAEYLILYNEAARDDSVWCNNTGLVDKYEDTIPDTIKFIIVTLQPRWETERNG